MRLSAENKEKIEKSYIYPAPGCNHCPRLYGFRLKNQQDYPQFFNAPVPSFGELTSELLIVGLAPGLKGANATGRPFTGDYAGLVLYHALLAHGFAKGKYNNGDADTLELHNCRITNAVRCVPPENKPEPSEIKECNNFLVSEIASMPKLKVILSLGSISHNAVLKALGYKPSHAKFLHGVVHSLTSAALSRDIALVDSYHCSRYNINTGRLTEEMFARIMQMIQQELA